MPKPVAAIETLTGARGAEDIVALPLGNGTVRLFVREACRAGSCETDGSRIGRADLGTGETPGTTELAWRPLGPTDFQPLGMSLTISDRTGSAMLFVLDQAWPPSIWRLPIVDGEVMAKDVVRWPNQSPSPASVERLLTNGNDIQGVGDLAYVTRYDPLGVLPWRGSGWPGVLKVDGGSVAPFADGLRGANGIIDLGPGRELVVADYWGRRLRRVSKDPMNQKPLPDATSELPIHPDNLTLDGDRILIAGQKYAYLAAVNLLLPDSPSPSAVLGIGKDQLGPDAKPMTLWQGGWSYGKSVSVAVSVPGGLALGQIRTPGILRIACEPSER